MQSHVHVSWSDTPAHRHLATALAAALQTCALLVDFYYCSAMNTSTDRLSQSYWKTWKSHYLPLLVSVTHQKDNYYHSCQIKWFSWKVAYHMNYKTLSHNILPSVLWRCWLGGRKGIRSVKNRVVGCWCGCLSGARCRLAYGPADATVTHCFKRTSH